MTLETQFKIKNDKYYQRFIREYSSWYKILNRYPENFKFFEDKVREVYKLRPTDRISKAIDTFDMIQTVLSSLKR